MPLRKTRKDRQRGRPQELDTPVKISCMIPKSVKDDLTEQADVAGISFGAMIRKALEGYLMEGEEDTLQDNLMGSSREGRLRNLAEDNGYSYIELVRNIIDSALDQID